MSEWKVGDIGYVIDDYSIEKVKITNIQYRIITCSWRWGERICDIDDIYKSESEAKEAKIKNNKKIKQEYREQIKKIEDLVKFMYIHPMNAEEYTDWIAQDVAIEKAKEFGIELG